MNSWNTLANAVKHKQSPLKRHSREIAAISNKLQPKLKKLLSVSEEETDDAKKYLKFISSSHHPSCGFYKDAQASRLTTIIPVVGLFITVGMLLKDLYEATTKYTEIAENYNLQQFGIDTSNAARFATTALSNRQSIIRKLEGAIDDNKNNPDNLIRLLDVINILDEFTTEVVQSVYSAIYLGIDIASLLLIALTFVPTAGLGAIATLIIELLISIAVVWKQLGDEDAIHRDFNLLKLKIQQIAEDQNKPSKSGEPKKLPENMFDDIKPLTF